MSGPTKTYLVLSSLFIAIISSGYFFYGRQGLIWSFMLSLLVHWLLYTYFDQKLFDTFLKHPLEGQDPWGLRKLLENISQRAKIPMPELYIAQGSHFNSFSLAKHHGKSRIILSQAAAEQLEKEEVAALLAFEVAKIKRLDTVSMSLAAALTAAALFPCRPFELHHPTIPFVRRSFLNRFLLYFLGLPAMLLRRLLIRSSTYYAIDELATHYIDSPKNLAKTLWKLSSYAGTQKNDVPLFTAHLFAVNPLTKSGWSRYFQAQPPVEKRIRRLIGYYPV